MDKKQIDELVAEFTHLVEELRSGKITIASHSTDIKEPFFLKTKKKIKGEKISIEYVLHATIDKKAAGHKRLSDIGKHRGSKKAHANKSLLLKEIRAGKPADFYQKKIKKNMASVWRTISSRIVNKDSVMTGDLDALRKYTKMNPYLAKSWHAEWRACCDAIDQCLDAVVSGDLQKASDLVAEVNEMMKHCHKLHK